MAATIRWKLFCWDVKIHLNSIKGCRHNSPRNLHSYRQAAGELVLLTLTMRPKAFSSFLHVNGDDRETRRDECVKPGKLHESPTWLWHTLVIKLLSRTEVRIWLTMLKFTEMDILGAELQKIAIENAKNCVNCWSWQCNSTTGVAENYVDCAICTMRSWRCISSTLRQKVNGNLRICIVNAKELTRLTLVNLRINVGEFKPIVTDGLVGIL